jgi:uncharacterized protein (DUF2236 family)
VTPIDLLSFASSQVRTTIAGAIGSRVRGPNGDAITAEVFNPDNAPGWFGPDASTRIVHGDAAMFIGGLRALLLQSLHPRAMAGVAQHSNYRDDPWGRLQRTAEFLVRTTYGSAAQADAACAMVQRVHTRVNGVTADGENYSANEPWLLAWVHACEVDSFLTANQRYGHHRLTPAQADAYVAEMAKVAITLGADPVPTSTKQLRDVLRGYRSELRRTPEALDAARFLMVQPPLPIVVRPIYGTLATAAPASVAPK